MSHPWEPMTAKGWREWLRFVFLNGVSSQDIASWSDDQLRTAVCDAWDADMKSRGSFNVNAKSPALDTPDPIDVNPTAERWGWTRLNFPPGVKST